MNAKLNDAASPMPMAITMNRIQVPSEAPSQSFRARVVMSGEAEPTSAAGTGARLTLMG